MKKEIIIYFSKLSIGGMERSLIEFLKNSNLSKNYNLTLYVGYSIEDSFLEEAKKYANVKLICKGKWNLIGKVKTYIIMQLTCIKYIIKKPNYYAAISYAYQHKILAKLTKLSSKNNIIFIHTDLIKSREPKVLKKLLNNIKFEEFKKVVCVSERAKKSFMELIPNYQGKTYVINNYINGADILEKSKENVDDYEFNGKTFINISRQVEKEKQISFIIEAAKKLNNEHYKFNVLLIGDGVDHNYYQEMIKNYGLYNVKAIGSRVNPYKYLKNSSVLIVTSKFEGYGMVLDEARVLNIPIITTDVGNGDVIANKGYGVICENSANGVYNSMKNYLENGLETKHFDYKSFNQRITEQIDDLIEGEL